MKGIRKSYESKKTTIQSQLESFKNLSEEKQFKEFLFCLLTPQSNGQRCWQAVEELSNLPKLKHHAVLNILKTKTRFHITKTPRILKAKKTWQIIRPQLNNSNIKELRNFIAKTVNGYGLKEASHFIRNIGLSNNRIAILDRHILKNLKHRNIIQETKIQSPKHYLGIENLYLDFARSIRIPADELDLLWWGQENGEIFK